MDFLLNGGRATAAIFWHYVLARSRQIRKKLRGKKVVRPVNESVCDVLETYLAFIEGEDKYERSLACAKPITSFLVSGVFTLY